MGFFKDAFESLTDKGSFIAPIIGDSKAKSSIRARKFIDKNVSPYAGLGSFLQSSAGQKMTGNSGTSRLLASVGGIGDPGGSIIGTVFNERGREKWAKKIGLQDDEGETPPDVGPGPGVGSGDIAARREARRRAIAAARSRRARGTTATSPLGVQGPGAATGQKRLLGE